MLQAVSTGSFPIDRYTPVVGEDQISRLRELAEPLKGRRIAHINATSYGGGVAELLRATVPLLQDLGVDASWQVIHGSAPLFEVTKGFHNALQGASYDLTQQARETYLEANRRNAALLEHDYDFIFVHDPQPAAMANFSSNGKATWIWRCHIDTSHRDPEVWGFLEPYLQDYQVWIFTLPEFVPPGLPPDDGVSIIHPAIDPLSPKNMPLTPELQQRILQWVGVDTDRPLMVQVSRFDPWKDPLGTLEVYRRVRDSVPGLQLAMLGHLAGDDPEGGRIFAQVKKEAGDDSDIHLFTNYTAASSVEVNAFQRSADVVIQKSIREGFGLVVAEAMWKGAPVVGGRVGGIPLQMPEGVGGVLVDNVDDAAHWTQRLLMDREERDALGQAGQQHIRQHFLITRYLEDELRLLNALLDGGSLG